MNQKKIEWLEDAILLVKIFFAIAIVIAIIFSISYSVSTRCDENTKIYFKSHSCAESEEVVDIDLDKHIITCADKVDSHVTYRYSRNR